MFSVNFSCLSWSYTCYCCWCFFSFLLQIFCCVLLSSVLLPKFNLRYDRIPCWLLFLAQSVLFRVFALSVRSAMYIILWNKFKLVSSLFLLLSQHAPFAYTFIHKTRRRRRTDTTVYCTESKLVNFASLVIACANMHTFTSLWKFEMPPHIHWNNSIANRDSAELRQDLIQLCIIIF